MTFGVHQTYIKMAQTQLDMIKEGKTDASIATGFQSYTINEGKELFDLAAGAREYSKEIKCGNFQWLPDKLEQTKEYFSYPDGKTDVITNSDIYGPFSTTSIAYDDNYDKTPNSIKHEYYNPSTEYVFDENGNCISMTEAEHDKPKHKENYQYNTNNQLIYREIDEEADGVIDEKQYFTYCHDQVSTITYEKKSGNNYYMTLDENGRTVKDKHYNEKYNSETTGKYTYDDEGKLIAFRQKSQYVDDLYEYYYDKDDNLCAVEYENKFAKTFKGFFIGLFGDLEKDVTMDVRNLN